MKNLNSFQRYGSLESFALDQTEQFLRPRTFWDLIYLLMLLFWFTSAVVFPSTTIFRATLFFIGVGLFLYIPVYDRITKDDTTTASSLNRGVKFLIFYVLILFFTSNQVPSFEMWDGIFLQFTYGEIERTIVCLLIPFSYLIRSFSPETLKFGYSFYVGRICQGYWSAILILFLLKVFRIYIPIAILEIDVELLLLTAYGAFLIGNILPGTPPQLELTTTAILEHYMAFRSRTERFRDALLLCSIILIIFLFLQWIQTYQEIFQYFGFIGLILGIILIFISRKPTTNGFSSLLNSITGQSIDPSSQLGNRVQDFAKTIKETEFQKPEKVYTIPTDGMKIISKGKTTLTAKKGSIAVPTVTEKGTALVLMGKSEIETKTEDETSKKKVDGSTTVWIPPEEWEEIKVHLNPKDVNELSPKDLISTGMEDIKNIDDVFKSAKKAFNELKSWQGPKGIFSSVLDETHSRYAITETKDYTLVRLPGIFVFESSGIEIVNVLGGLVKVIEIKGVGEYVQVLGGFITVMETPDYSFVQAPIVSVLETPQGEVVKVFGIQIQEGEKIDISQARERIIKDQIRFDSLFTKKIETLFQEDPQLLLAESEGERIGVIVGEDEILTDTKIERRRKKHRHKRKTRQIESESEQLHEDGFKGIVTSPNVKLSKISPQGEHTNVITLDLEADIQNSHELKEIEEALIQIEDSLDKLDEKFLNDKISEAKHTEMAKRLKDKQSRLIDKKERIIEQSKPKLI